ncbi:MAG TPA: hypothetical protein PKH79_15280 [Prolixibacteraceae bacterium]|nr:hypothetical protein [Prolixibacteraceae bacterium]
MSVNTSFSQLFITTELAGVLANKTQIEKTDQTIDSMVSQLYGLDDELEADLFVFLNRNDWSINPQHTKRLCREFTRSVFHSWASIGKSTFRFFRANADGFRKTCL